MADGERGRWESEHPGRCYRCLVVESKIRCTCEDDVRPEWFDRCVGMTYEALSREAARLIEGAHKTGSWHDKLDQLVFLRGQMQYHTTRSARHG